MGKFFLRAQMSPPPTEMRNCQKTEKLQSATLARASTVSCENVKCNNNNNKAAACSTSTSTATATTTTTTRRKGDNDRMVSSLPITILPPPSPPATFATDFSVAIEHCRREQQKEQNCCSSPPTSSFAAAIRICFVVQIAFLLLSTGLVFAQQQLQQQQQQQQQQFSINNLNFYLRNNRKHNFSANRELVANSLSFSSDRMTTTTTTTTTNRSFHIDPFLSLIVDKKSNNFTNAADDDDGDDGAEDAASTGLAPSVDQEHSPRSVAAADHRRFHFNESSSPFVEDGDNLMRLVMEGLGLERLPDYRKANISQKEYAAKYSEYLSRVYERQRREIQLLNSQLPHQSGDPFAQIEWEKANRPLHMMTFQHNATAAAAAAAVQYRQRRKRSAAAAAAPDEASEAIKFYSRQKNRIHLHFPLNIEADAIQAADIEEANVRLLLISSPALAAKSVRFAGKLSQRNQRNMKRKKKAKKRKKKKEKNKSKTPPTPQSPSPPSPPPPPPQRHILNMKVYQVLEPRGRLWLDGQKVDIEIDRSKGDETTSKWLEFDVTKAVEGWLLRNQTNLGLEIQCDNCYRNGARIIDDFSDDDDDDDEMMEDVEADDDDDDIPSRHFDLAPVLNIIGRLGATHREKRSRHPSPPREPNQAKHNQHQQHQQHHHQSTASPPPPAAAPRSKTNCYKDNQRCCRHAMDVVFKEIKGFEFIIQPKGFDAGYCRGRCPPRYNPAHHHALLQSLIWKQDHGKVPRPCCAPSKLMELEVLHVDEKDNEKLKISTWTDMRVLECACS